MSDDGDDDGDDGGGWSDPHRCEACGFVGALRFAGADAWTCEECGMQARLSEPRVLKDLARSESPTARGGSSRETG